MLYPQEAEEAAAQAGKGALTAKKGVLESLGGNHFQSSPSEEDLFRV